MKDLIRKILNENEFDWLDSGKDILQSKGFDLMDYLVKTYPVGTFGDKESIIYDIYANRKYIVVDDKTYWVDGRKKELTNKIYFDLIYNLQEEGVLPEEIDVYNQGIIRRAIKDFLNNLST
jgi:hypothetical protein